MTRRLFLLGFLLLSGSAGAFAADPPDLTGVWTIPGSDALAFSLDLTQHGQQLSGYHSVVVRSGDRVDTVLAADGSPSIVGTVTRQVAHVRFQSGYDKDGHGEATLILRPDGTLVWKLTKSAGTHYLPDTATLRRQPR